MKKWVALWLLCSFLAYGYNNGASVHKDTDALDMRITIAVSCIIGGPLALFVGMIECGALGCPASWIAIDQGD